MAVQHHACEGGTGQYNITRVRVGQGSTKSHVSGRGDWAVQHHACEWEGDWAVQHHACEWEEGLGSTTSGVRVGKGDWAVQHHACEWEGG